MAKKEESKSTFSDVVTIIKDVSEIFSSIFKSKSVKAFSLSSKIYEFLINKVKEEIGDVAKRLKKVVISSLFFLLGLVFLLIGGTMYLAKLIPSLQNGLNFVSVGAFFFIISLLFVMGARK
jgi:hypothetical protein